MTDTERKDWINAMTRRSCLPDAKVVFVRNVTEEVLIESPLPESACLLIHPDVTTEEFFKQDR
jgi:hypothetical protein